MEAGPSNEVFAVPSAPSAVRPKRRPARTASKQAHYDSGAADAPKTMGKLKLKIGAFGAALTGVEAFMQGYDRDLDSDEDEPLCFEEQFVLRMAPGPDCDHLREMVTKRAVDPDKVWFKFLDSRHAVVNVGANMYAARLVDLPCIVESQKTLNGRQMYKAGDICQMLLVEHRISTESEARSTKPFNPNDFIYPHGITPPMRHARKRRFRKRIDKRTIEEVERHVEKLLASDNAAQGVEFDLVDPEDDVYESEGSLPPAQTPVTALNTPAIDPELATGPQTPAAAAAANGAGSDSEGYDSDLAAEIEGFAKAEAKKQEAKSATQGDSSDEELFGGESGSSEDEDQQEKEEDQEIKAAKGKVRQFLEEIKDLEAAISRKNVDIQRAANPMLKKRFEDNLRKLQAELKQKRDQHAAAVAESEESNQPPPEAAGDGDISSLSAVKTKEGSRAASPSTKPRGASRDPEASGSEAEQDADPEGPDDEDDQMDVDITAADSSMMMSRIGSEDEIAVQQVGENDDLDALFG